MVAAPVKPGGIDSDAGPERNERSQQNRGYVHWKVFPMLDKINVGDTVYRRFGTGTPVHELKVTAVDEHRIYCGAWTFSRRNGAEIDEDLGWDEHETGSYITAEK